MHVHHYHQLARVDDDFVITEMNTYNDIWVYKYPVSFNLPIYTLSLILREIKTSYIKYTKNTNVYILLLIRYICASSYQLN